MHLFKPSSSSSSTAIQDHQTSAFLGLFGKRGVEACAAQEAELPQALFNAAPTHNSQKAIALAECIEDPTGSLKHKLLCAKMISKLDPKARHLQRITPLLNLYCRNPIKHITSPIFPIFQKDLSDKHIEQIHEQINQLFLKDEKNHEHIARALQVLSLIFSRSKTDAQDSILDLLLTYINMHSATTNFRLAAIEALANVSDTQEHHRDKIFKAMLQVFYDPQDKVSDAIATVVGNIFAEAYIGDERSENAIMQSNISEMLDDANIHARLTAAKALAAMFHDMDDHQQKSVQSALDKNNIFKEYVLPPLQESCHHTLEKAGIILGILFELASETQKQLLIDPLLDFLSSNVLPVRKEPLLAATRYFPHATKPQQDKIIKTCAGFIYAHWLRKDAAHELAVIGKDTSEENKKIIDHALNAYAELKTNSPQAPTLHTIEPNEDLTLILASLPARSFSDMPTQPASVNTVNAHIIAFCGQTLVDVVPGRASQLEFKKVTVTPKNIKN